jgi:ATP-dependent Lhr-like helicase
VRVEDAGGAAPNIPFWLGEAPGRSDELSMGVARLRAEIEPSWRAVPGGAMRSDLAVDWLEHLGLDDDAARQIVDYLARARAALGALPTHDTLVMERFFDESGGMQLVMHTPFGSRINRAWGLALRKRFCRTFNFELQAAATEDAIVLSLSTSHSFVLDEVWRYLKSASAEHDPGAGAARCAAVQRALALERDHGAGPAALCRRAQGRAAAAAHEERRFAGLGLPRPGVRLPGKHRRRTRAAGSPAGRPDPGRLPARGDGQRRLAGPAAPHRSRRRRLVARDLPAPSPLAMEILNARPYAFLDDAPLEERRTQAVINRRWTDPAIRPTTWARSTLDAIAGVARKPGRARATATRCRRRWWRWPA